MAGSLIVIAGPSGVGKGTLIRRVLQADPNLWLSVSATTRAPRVGEVDGEDYVFVSESDFKKLVESNGLLEWAEFAGNHYGTPALPVLNRIARGIDVLLEIDLQGVRQVRNNMASARTVFVAPPSVDALKERLAGRGTEDRAAIARRLAAAQEELDAAGEFDCVIVNDDVEVAADLLLTWIHNDSK
jgi:guanylate kinase